MSIRLYIGNLPEDVTREDLEAVFNPEGGEVLFSAKLITDRKTGKCRGFGFVTVNTDEEADQFIEKFNGVTVKETTLKIEKALPRTMRRVKARAKKGLLLQFPSLVQVQPQQLISAKKLLTKETAAAIKAAATTIMPTVRPRSTSLPMRSSRILGGPLYLNNSRNSLLPKRREARRADRLSSRVLNPPSFESG